MASSKGNSNSHGGSNHPAAGAWGDDDEDNSGRQNAVNADANASKKIGPNSSRLNNNGRPKKRRRKHGNLRRVINIPEARVDQGQDEYAYISEHEENERELLPITTRRSYLTNIKPFNVGAIADEAWQSQVEQEEEEKTGNNASTRKIGIKLPRGNGRGVGGGRKRCYCFNCW